jgi:hypothetical protein
VRAEGADDPPAEARRDAGDKAQRKEDGREDGDDEGRPSEEEREPDLSFEGPHARERA